MDIFAKAIDRAFQIELDLPGFDAAVTVADIEHTEDLARNDRQAAAEFALGCAEATTIRAKADLFTALADDLTEAGV